MYVTLVAYLCCLILSEPPSPQAWPQELLTTQYCSARSPGVSPQPVILTAWCPTRRAAPSRLRLYTPEL